MSKVVLEVFFFFRHGAVASLTPSRRGSGTDWKRHNIYTLGVKDYKKNGL